jgi:hypothetical protein
MKIRPSNLCAIVISGGKRAGARFMKAAGGEFGAVAKIFLGWLDGPEGSCGYLVSLPPR